MMRSTFIPLSLALVPLLLLAACGPREEPPVMGAPVAAPASVEVPPPGPSQAPVAKDEPRKKAQEESTIPTRDLRRSASSPRKRALLVSEIQAMSQLLSSMSPTAVDRPALLRRLGNDYVELEYAAQLDGSNDVAADARREAISNFTTLVDHYPADPDRDEALFNLAYEQEMGGDPMSARKRYYELIQKHPQSKYIPNAYLAFGEMFFAEAGGGDPSKFALAEQAYNEVVKYPPPNNKVYGYAFYKLAQVSLVTGDAPKALHALKKTIDHGKAFPQLPNATLLADVARKDVPAAYAMTGDPRSAFNFFLPLSGDPTGEKQRTFDMMGRLGEAYTTGGRYSEASVLYQELRTRDATHACRWSAYQDDADKALHGNPQPPTALESALHACGP